jgi:hypothetical protein
MAFSIRYIVQALLTAPAKFVASLETRFAALEAGTSVEGVNGTAIGAGGALSAGQVLRATGAAAAEWGAVNLADTDAVTGVLPSANMTDAAAGAKGIVQLAGDLAGTGSAAATPRVGAINSTTVPAGGALTVGNVPQVSGVSALTYGPINLAGGANYVTGALPRANTTFQSGVGALTNGVSASIAATITASSRITVTPKDKGASSALGRLDAPSADRSVGAPGSFLVRSFKADATAETADQSTFDWTVEG